jgi:tRNA nucleotidyltransferase (CCA-adding enzyme)
MPKEVQQILDTIKILLGKKAYIVGGCVRDSLLGRTPKDWDITTDATPNEIKSTFNYTIDTGLQHGTVTVMVNNTPFEVTTFRIDGNYSDGRRPDSVAFTADIKEDLARRDFTINAMAYNHEEGLIDPFNGQCDLNKKVIKCVGNPQERFEEDALRMMRAVRFAAQLGFQWDVYTYSAIIKNAENIQKVSAERVREEINKILLSSNPELIGALNPCGLMQYILPEFEVCFCVEQNNPYHVYNVGRHILETIKATDSVLELRLAALFHDIGKSECKTTDENGIDHFHSHALVSTEKTRIIMQRLRYDNEMIEKVTDLVFYHDVTLQPEYPLVRRWLNRMGEENFSNLLHLRVADIMGQNPDLSSERIIKVAKIRTIMNNIIAQKQCFTLKDLAVNGFDLRAIGYKTGVKLGEMLKELLNIVIENPTRNDKEQLIAYAKERLQENEGY